MGNIIIYKYLNNYKKHFIFIEITLFTVDVPKMI